jgi:hypothetical protein
MKTGKAQCMLCALALIACDSEPSEPDAGVDSGSERADAGADAGTDAGPVVTVDCSSVFDDGFYDTPDPLPEYGPDERGRLVRCASAEALDVATVRERARRPIDLDPEEPDNYTGPELSSGATVTMIGYRTERLDGSESYATGTLYLPDGDAGDLPLVVHVSGTTGLGDACAPSRRRFTDLERTLYVLIGRGNAVLVPDLIGLGTDGTYAYLEPNEAAHAVLDGARAALSAAPDGTLSGEIFVSGHSAGGHAALSTQALQRGYAPDLNVVAVSGIAPAWFDLTVFRTAFVVPSYSTDPDVNGNSAVFATMFYVGYGAAYDGEDRAWDPITATIRDDLRTDLATACIQSEDGEPTAAEAIFALAPDVSDLFERSFRNGVQTCLFGGCDAVGMAWDERFAASRPALDPEGPALWFHVGTDDTTITLDRVGGILDESGFGTACCYSGATHNTMAGVSAPWHSDWVSALASGGSGTAPTCPDLTLEECLGGPATDGGTGDLDAGTAMDAGMDAGVPDAGP